LGLGFQEGKVIFTQIKTILEGKTSVSLFSEFLRRNNKTDLLILKTTKVRQIEYWAPIAQR